MQSRSQFTKDISRLLNGLAGTMAGVGRETAEAARERTREFVAGMDFISRDEFEAVKDMAAKAREEADALKARVDALEKAAAAGTKK